MDPRCIITLITSHPFQIAGLYVASRCCCPNYRLRRNLYQMVAGGQYDPDEIKLQEILGDTFNDLDSDDDEYDEIDILEGLDFGEDGEDDVDVGADVEEGLGAEGVDGSARARAPLSDDDEANDQSDFSGDGRDAFAEKADDDNGKNRNEIKAIHLL